MTSALVFVVSLGAILAIDEARDALARRRHSRDLMKMQALTPSKWSEDVMSYYKTTKTRRQLS